MTPVYNLFLCLAYFIFKPSHSTIYICRVHSNNDPQRRLIIMMINDCDNNKLDHDNTCYIIMKVKKKKSNFYNYEWIIAYLKSMRKILYLINKKMILPVKYIFTNVIDDRFF